MDRISFYENCLFCGVSLTNENRFYEHIIPANIYGFLVSEDICYECGKTFGKNIDDLAIKQTSIIEALNQLGHPKASDYERKLPYFGKAKDDDTKIEMVKKDKGFEIKNIDGIMDDAALPWILRNWVKEKFKHLPDDTASDEINRVVEELKKAEPDQIVESELLVQKYQRKRLEGPFLDYSRIEPITPLIAKIAVFAIYYFINLAQIRKIKDLQILRNHALISSELGPIKIFEGRNRHQKIFEKIHKILIWFYPNLIFIRLDLFQILQWSIILDLTEPIIMKNNKDDIKVIGLKLDLENQLLLPQIL